VLARDLVGGGRPLPEGKSEWKRRPVGVDRLGGKTARWSAKGTPLAPQVCLGPLPRALLAGDCRGGKSSNHPQGVIRSGWRGRSAGFPPPPSAKTQASRSTSRKLAEPTCLLRRWLRRRAGRRDARATAADAREPSSDDQGVRGDVLAKELAARVVAGHRRRGPASVRERPPSSAPRRETQGGRLVVEG